MRKALIYSLILFFVAFPVSVFAADQSGMGVSVKAGLAKRSWRPTFDPTIGCNLTFPLLKYQEYDASFLTGLDVIYSVSQTLDPGLALNMYNIPLSLRATKAISGGLVVSYDAGLVIAYFAAPGATDLKIGYHAGVSAVYDITDSMALRAGLATYSTSGPAKTASGATVNVSDSPLLLTVGLTLQ